MTSEKKLIEKLLNSPQNLRYNEIERLFKNERYIIREGKGSHKRIIFVEDKSKFVTIAIHNNDCKISGKIALQEFYIITNKLWNK